MEHFISEQTAQFEDRWHFSHAVSSRGLLFCSGVTGTREDGSVDSDPTDQFEQLFMHLQQYLAAAGATFDDVVEVTTYHVDMARHLSAFEAVKDAHLLEPYPAWSAIGVSELITPGALVELRAVAEHP